MRASGGGESPSEAPMFSFSWTSSLVVVCSHNNISISQNKLKVNGFIPSYVLSKAKEWLQIMNAIHKKEMYYQKEQDLSYVNIYATGVDELVRKAALNILENGIKVKVRAGNAMQAYSVNYILTDPRNRLHTLRNGAIRYLCRELLAYFDGSLKASDGLTKASQFWKYLEDENGEINSNYGYYVFHEKVDRFENQYGWVIKRLLDNQDSRRAIININQNYHKSDTKDFPCTVAIQFFIKNNKLYCEVMSRSTDVVTGLPYDMGFFSFLHELVFQDLKEQGITNLELGFTIMKTSFTQIYERTLNKAVEVISGRELQNIKMPAILYARNILDDIYNKTRNSNVIQWVNSQAEVK